MKRRFAVLMGSALLLAAVAAPAANAATYPASDNSVSSTDGSTDIAAGDEAEFSAQTFQAGSDVTFTVSSPASSLGSSRGGAALAGTAASGTCATGSSCVVVADSDGVATALISFTQAGTQTITATGIDRNGEALTVSSTVTVAAADDGTDPGTDDADDNGSGTGLANTGANIIKFGVIGLGLVALGLVLVVALRRRSPGSTV